MYTISDRTRRRAAGRATEAGTPSFSAEAPAGLTRACLRDAGFPTWLWPVAERPTDAELVF